MKNNDNWTTRHTQDMIDIFKSSGMIKLQKIRKAYGRFYNPKKHHFSVNGWVNLNEWDEQEVGELIDEINLEFREHSARPKELIGIENLKDDVPAK